MLHEGSKAPAWKGTDQDGSPCSSLEFSGKWLLLYFYPKDDTPGCTTEACGFRDSYTSLKDRVAIVGVSADSVESHKQFVDKYQLPFTLIADPDRAILNAYGIVTEFPKRTSFLIDPSGTIRKIYHGFNEHDHAADVQKDIDSFGVGVS